MRANLKFGACERDVQSEEDFSFTSYLKSVVPKVGVLTPSGVAGAVAGGREMISRNNDFACLLTRGPSLSH